ncbi:hypothetical protein TNCV_891351 [Trichonephila clavipes]|nr:hypothetical protein TNCV_891351 [Trichonephila clavipes]
MADYEQLTEFINAPSTFIESRYLLVVRCHIGGYQSPQVSVTATAAQIGEAYSMMGRRMVLYNRTFCLNASLLLGEIKRFRVHLIPAAFWWAERM